MSICLAMIVKDEAHVIERCLDSVKNFIDYFVICDTGSTDGTQDVVLNYLNKNGLKGEIHQHEWVHFGHNRSLSFKAAKGKCDYIMTIDADEVFAPYANGGAVLDQTVYSVEGLVGDIVLVTSHYNSLRYLRPQFFKDDREWYWDQPVHETPVCGDGGETASSHMNNCCIYVRSEGARSKQSEEEKYLKDAGLLEEWLKDRPDDTRAAFYVSQSYGDAGHYKKAIAKANSAMKIIDYASPMTYVLLLRKARWSAFLGANDKKIVKLLEEAHKSNPERPEAALDLMRCYAARKDWENVVRYGVDQAHHQEVPVMAIFAQRNAWTWETKFLLGEAYLNLDRPDLAYQFFEEALLYWNFMSEKTEQQIKDNIKIAKQRL